jgi:hypothetical protein
VSAKVTVVPSASSTRRPRHSQASATPSATSWPVRRAKVSIIACGNRARALQYAAVLLLHGVMPAIKRLTAASSTTCRQLPSAESACAMNIDSVSAGGNSRSRCSGSSDSRSASSSGPVRGQYRMALTYDIFFMSH